jgi:hypothetical protein
MTDNRNHAQSVEEFVDKYDRQLIQEIAADGSAAAAAVLKMTEGPDDAR